MKPKRFDDKYWTGTRNFNHISYESDLEEYIFSLEQNISIKEVHQKLLSMRIDEVNFKKLNKEDTLEAYGWTNCLNDLIEWTNELKADRA